MAVGVAVAAMPQCTIGLASSGRSRSGMAAKVGRIVPWLSSLVVPMLDPTASSHAASVAGAVTVAARSAPVS
jgi:hypothetical protein